jgi:hypothetical protein
VGCLCSPTGPISRLTDPSADRAEWSSLRCRKGGQLPGLRRQSLHPRKRDLRGRRDCPDLISPSDTHPSRDVLERYCAAPAQRVGRDERHGWIGAVGTTHGWIGAVGTTVLRNQPRLLGVAFDKDSKTCRSQKSTCSKVSMTTPASRKCRRRLECANRGSRRPTRRVLSDRAIAIAIKCGRRDIDFGVTVTKRWAPKVIGTGTGCARERGS